MNWLNEAVKPVCNELEKKGRAKLSEMYRRCFASTWDTTLQRADGTVFLITGDIPAMWLRDSSAQVFHYLPHAKDYPEVEQAVEGLLHRQFGYIARDPYANAFNKTASGGRYSNDDTDWTSENKPWIWERKYEIDSLCYPVRLAYAFWKKSGNTAWCDETFVKAAHTIVDTWETEQYHAEKSPYYFNRPKCRPSDTLTCGGKGNPVGYTGMTWSGFRPSDDACRYGYLVPSNLFAVRALTLLIEISKELLKDEAFSLRCEKLRGEIREGIEKYAIVKHPVYGDVYAYEVDGLGNYHFMDDANVPGLLSLPYLECVDADDPVYLNTRRLVLSRENPHYYEGKCLSGIGSPHTPEDYIWPISLCIQGLTSIDADEIRRLADQLENCDAGTYLMHEGVHKDDPAVFTRDWFAWANSIFSEFVEKAVSYI